MIRWALETDIPSLVEFQIAMAKESENFTLNYDTVSLGVAAVFTHPEKGKYFVVENNGLLLGCLMITYEWSDWRCAPWWWIQSVYVVKNHRKQGVFKKMFDYVKSLAQESGACGLRLYVHNHNTIARDVYSHLGMTSSNTMMEFVL